MEPVDPDHHRDADREGKFSRHPVENAEGIQKQLRGTMSNQPARRWNYACLTLPIMWNKDQVSSTPPTSAAPVRPTTEDSSSGGARVGSTMRIKGDIFSKEEIVVDGEVTGNIEAKDRLTIGASAKVDAAIKAAEVVVAGTVKGNVEATQRIVLRKGANLVGDVKTAGIVIEDGAFFRGGIDIARTDVPQPGR